ncbi:MAG TPA: YggT family protein [Candidatus Omnitrophota bacterium]|nr:YggT family protein [Candidatus Omnitrophota bacterium]HRY85879.1 YggT family protein [Candidatus Omnitrophota bacterium]
MFVFGVIFKGLAMLVNGICTILYWLLFARIIVSWFPVDPFSGPMRFLTQVTDPILEPLRRLPLRIGMLDFSPLVAFFMIYVTNQVLVTVLLRIAYQFQ